MFRKFIGIRPRLENALSALDKHRLKLPVLSLALYFPDFAQRPVAFHEVPVGPWSSPIADVTMLLKVVVCARPRRTMEVGSYRGYTALGIARHMPDDGQLVTVDRYPDHGEAYRNTSFEAKIERRVGDISPQMLRGDEPASYDLIFLDAGHRYSEVKHDSELLLPLLSPSGHFLWHDYANWGRFSKENGVPEYLHEVSATIPVARIGGTGLAVHCPAWTDTGKAAFTAGLEPLAILTRVNPWKTGSARG